MKIITKRNISVYAEFQTHLKGLELVIARSEIQMGTGNEFLNFNLIKK